MTTAQMDEAYSRPELYWGTEPTQVCELLLAHVSAEDASRKVLIDIGCGEGRDAVHYGKRGFAVIAMDISAPGLVKAARWARDENISLETVQADILHFRLDRPVDVIASSGALQYIPPALRAEVFDNYKRWTRAGGLAAFSAFVEKPFIAPPPDGTPEEYPYRSGEILGYYWDWEILSFSEIIFDCMSSGVPHRHAMDVVLARKVGE